MISHISHIMSSFLLLSVILSHFVLTVTTNVVSPPPLLLIDKSSLGFDGWLDAEIKGISLAA